VSDAAVADQASNTRDLGAPGLLAPTRSSPADIPDLTAFLRRADLTLSGLDSPAIRLWILRDRDGLVRGSTGYEVCPTGEHALIRSVAVDKECRGQGLGLVLGQFALDRAAEEGATRAWLFSRRSGAFWQRLGFAAADRARLARVLADTHQVRLFLDSGQLEREVAWSRSLRQS
jgi:N-acetylglutamate synthase-like GNAT family acetyltransferase